ncbi:MAG TPA: hypothetical protein VNI83_12845, partial [Vicinamibacterales bacterium]|nr:hypothetical protein [Vicinamibacterales bacterium]
MSGREASDLVRSVAAGGETTGRGVAVAGPLGRRLAARIRAEGPVPAVSFLEAALYDPEHGYYAGAARRSGCAGDFFTSADVGPLFGELLAVQIGEMLALVAEGDEAGAANLDLVEA